MNLIDIHTKANTELGGGRRKGQVIHFHSAGERRYIKCCTRKTVYEKVFFFHSSYIVKEVRSIHLTNLHSLWGQVARSSTPSAKQKLNQLKLFFPKRKSYIPTIPKEWNQKNVVF